MPSLTWGMMPRLLRLASLLSVLIALAAVFGVLSSTPAHAQRPDLTGDPESACSDNPNSEACICRDAIGRALQPKADHWVPGSVPPRLINSIVTGWHDPPADVFVEVPPNSGHWFEVDGPDTDTRINIGDEPDLEVNDSFFKAACAHDYFEENLTRIWYFAVALASALFTLSVAWAAVMHMQEQATGQRNTVIRQILARVTVGILLLALAFVIWQAVAQAIWGSYLS